MAAGRGAEILQYLARGRIEHTREAAGPPRHGDAMAVMMGETMAPPRQRNGVAHAALSVEGAHHMAFCTLGGAQVPNTGAVMRLSRRNGHAGHAGQKRAPCQIRHQSPSRLLKPIRMPRAGANRTVMRPRNSLSAAAASSSAGRSAESPTASDKGSGIAAKSTWIRCSSA